MNHEYFHEEMELDEQQGLDAVEDEETPRIMERLDKLCEAIPDNYELNSICNNAKGQIRAMNYLASVAMIGLLTPVDSGIPAIHCGSGGRQRKAA